MPKKKPDIFRTDYDNLMEDMQYHSVDSGGKEDSIE